MKKGDVIRQKCVNTTFYFTGILAHKVNNTIFLPLADEERPFRQRKRCLVSQLRLK